MNNSCTIHNYYANGIGSGKRWGEKAWVQGYLWHTFIKRVYKSAISTQTHNALKS